MAAMHIASSPSPTSTPNISTPSSPGVASADHTTSHTANYDPCLGGIQLHLHFHGGKQSSTTAAGLANEAQRPGHDAQAAARMADDLHTQSPTLSSRKPAIHRFPPRDDLGGDMSCLKYIIELHSRRFQGKAFQTGVYRLGYIWHSLEIYIPPLLLFRFPGRCRRCAPLLSRQNWTIDTYLLAM